MLTLHPGPGKPGALPPAGTEHVVRSETTVLSTIATKAKWLQPRPGPELRQRREWEVRNSTEHTDLGASKAGLSPGFVTWKLYDLGQVTESLCASILSSLK